MGQLMTVRDRHVEFCSVGDLIDVSRHDHQGVRLLVNGRSENPNGNRSHFSFAGTFAFSKTVMVGESEELRLIAPSEAVEIAEANRDVIVGIKVRVGRGSSGTSRHLLCNVQPSC